MKTRVLVTTVLMILLALIVVGSAQASPTGDFYTADGWELVGPPTPAGENPDCPWCGLLHIEVDRGEGSTYQIGEPITVCYWVPYAVYIRIWSITSNGWHLVIQGFDDGTGDCLNGTVGSPEGRHTLRIEKIENNQVTDWDETWFNARGGGPVSASIWVDRGEGSTYYVGDRIRVCYDVSRPIYIRIWDCQAGSCHILIQGNDDGRGDCFWGTIEPPTGREDLTIEAIEGGRVVAQDQTYFYVRQRQPSPTSTRRPTRTPRPTATRRPTPIPPTPVPYTNLALRNLRISPQPAVVMRESHINVDIVNEGNTTFVPRDGDYTLVLKVKSAGKVVQKIVYSTEEFRWMNKLGRLSPGQAFHPNLPTTHFLADVSGGDLEAVLETVDPDPPQGNTTSHSVRINPNPEEKKTCIAAVINAATLLNIPTSLAAKVIVSVYKLVTIDIPNCNWNLVCVAKEVGKFFVGLKVPIVDTIDALWKLLNQPPSTCMNLTDYILMVIQQTLEQCIKERGPIDSILCDINLIILRPIGDILTINSAGQQAGFLENGQMVNEIPGARVVNTSRYRGVIFPGNDVAEIRFKASQSGYANLGAVFALPEGGGVSVKFNDVWANRGTRGTINARSGNIVLELDDNGDGRVDRRIPPDEIKLIGARTYLPFIER